MKTNATKAFDKLKAIGAPVTEGGDYGHFVISAEDNYDEVWADYWDGPRLERRDPKTGKILWAFGVNPKITRILDRHGLHAEWINPGMLGVYDD